MDIQCVSEKRALLGESPVWFQKENSIYWIDIIEKNYTGLRLSTKKPLRGNYLAAPGW